MSKRHCTTLLDRRFSTPGKLAICRWSSLAITLGLALAITLTACDRDFSTAPGAQTGPSPNGPFRDADPSPPSAPEGARVPGGFTLTVAVPIYDGSVPETLIGTITDTVLAEVKIKQRVEERHVDPVNVPNWLNIAGPLGDYVADQCILRARMYRKDSRGFIDPELYTGGCIDSGEPWEIANSFVFHPGGIYGNRRFGHPQGGGCGGYCLYYSGSTTYIFTPIAAKLVVKAVPKKLVTGYQVTLTASRSDGVALAAVRSWHWSPRDSTKPVVPLTSCGTNTTCTVTTADSLGTGWGIANAVIDGIRETARDYVEVLGCRTGDPLLDNVIIRDKLKALWDSSYDSASPNNRRERTMAVYDSAGVIVTRNLPLNPRSTPCKTDTLTYPNPAPGKLIADVHDHPFARGEALPANCGYPTGSVYGDEGFGGLSGQDWHSTQIPTPRHRVYAYDRDSVYRADSLLTTSDFVQRPSGKRVPRNNVWQQYYRTWARHQSGAGVACSIIP